MTDPNMKLVQQARNGSQDAYAKLYALLLPRARSYGYRMLHTMDHETDEFACDAVARVLLRLHMFKGEALFTTWATSVITNFALCKLRTNRTKLNTNMVYLDHPYNDESSPVDLPSGENLARTIETGNQLSLVLSKLKPHHTKILLDHYVLGMNNKDLCLAYNTTETTIKSRIMHAKREARVILDTLHNTPVEHHCRCGCGQLLTKRAWYYARGHAPHRKPKEVPCTSSQHSTVR